VPGLNELIDKLKEHYDKILAFLTLMILLVSLVYLAVNVGLIRKMQEDFDGWIDALRPLHPRASLVRSDQFDRATDNMEDPCQLDFLSWTNRAFVPESRMSCGDCRRPVPISVEICPHCGEEIDKAPPSPEDSDKDGMKDEWEKKYGLDRFDPSDADRDNDSDGFTNIEEYEAGTSPVKAAEHPPKTGKLRLERIQAEPFRLQFKSRVKTSDGKFKFGLNYRTRRETKTTFAKLDEVVEGFTIAGYEEKHKDVTKPFKRRIDVSELTLKRGEQTIVLIKGQARLHVELTAHFSLLIDDSKYHARLGDSFEFEGDQYKVIEIDREGERVVILCARTQTSFTVDRTSSKREKSSSRETKKKE